MRSCGDVAFPFSQIFAKGFRLIGVKSWKKAVSNQVASQKTELASGPQMKLNFSLG